MQPSIITPPPFPAAGSASNFYLQLRIYEREKQMRAQDHLMLTKKEREAIARKKPIPKWKVQNIDYNAWKKNKLDKGYYKIILNINLFIIFVKIIKLVNNTIC